MNKPSVRVDYSNMMSDFSGVSGLTAKELAASSAGARLAAAGIRQKRDDGLLAFMYLPYDAKAREEVKKTAELIRARFDTLVLAGTDPVLTAAGGILKALGQGKNLKNTRKNFSVKKTESCDPNTVYRAINSGDFKKTIYNICIKSPLSDADAAMIRVLWSAIAKKAGKKSIKDHVIITTDSDKGPASELARRHGLITFIAPSNVSGAFSVMSPAGLLPLACAGANIDDILKGAAHMDDACTAHDHRKNPAHMTALLYYLFDVRKNYSSSVFVPGCSALRGLLDWMTELWADSLSGRRGLKPFAYPGPKLRCADYRFFGGKHNDTVVTFFNIASFREDFSVPAANGGPEPGRELSAAKMSKVIEISRSALQASLASNGVPNMSVTLPYADEFSIGQFICLAEAQAVFMAELYGPAAQGKNENTPAAGTLRAKTGKKYII